MTPILVIKADEDIQKYLSFCQWSALLSAVLQVFTSQYWVLDSYFYHFLVCLERESQQLWFVSKNVQPHESFMALDNQKQLNQGQYSGSESSSLTFCLFRFFGRGGRAGRRFRVLLSPSRFGSGEIVRAGPGAMRAGGMSCGVDVGGTGGGG